MNALRLWAWLKGSRRDQRHPWWADGFHGTLPDDTEAMTRRAEQAEARVAELEAALRDIAEGRWNTARRVLHTPTYLNPREYARAALVANKESNG